MTYPDLFLQLFEWNRREHQATLNQWVWEVLSQLPCISSSLRHYGDGELTALYLYLLSSSGKRERRADCLSTARIDALSPGSSRIVLSASVCTCLSDTRGIALSATCCMYAIRPGS